MVKKHFFQKMLILASEVIVQLPPKRTFESALFFIQFLSTV